jgi:hypothetical protein
MVEMTLGKLAGGIAARETMPAHGVGAGTLVLTLRGAVPAETIAPGDRVVTRSGARVVRSVELAVLRGARVVRLGADVLGKARPEAEAVLAPDQPVLVRDWRAAVIAGATQAVVPAGRLVDGAGVRQELEAEVRIVSLRFDAPEVIYAAGLELGCPAA